MRTSFIVQTLIVGATLAIAACATTHATVAAWSAPPANAPSSPSPVVVAARAPAAETEPPRPVAHPQPPPAIPPEPTSVEALRRSPPHGHVQWLFGYWKLNGDAWSWMESHWETVRDHVWQPPVYANGTFYPGYWRGPEEPLPAAYRGPAAGRIIARQEIRQLAIPGRLVGTLTATDTPLVDGSVTDDVALELTAGHPVTIVVRGGPATGAPAGPVNLDMYAILVYRYQEVAHDDDSAGNQNSRIVFTPSESGVYVLRLTTYGAGLNTGAYEVETWDGEHLDAR